MGLFGLGLASLMAPLPGGGGDARPPSGGAAVTVPAGSEFARPRPETEPVLPQGTPAPGSAPVPRLPAPQPASLAPPPDSSLPVPTVADMGNAKGPTLAEPAAETAVPVPAVPTDPGAAARTPAALAAPSRDVPPDQPQARSGWLTQGGGSNATPPRAPPSADRDAP